MPQVTIPLPNRKEMPHMARLVGVDLPREKRVEIALTYIFGVGRTRAVETLAATGVDPNTRVHELTDDQLVAMRESQSLTRPSRVSPRAWERMVSVGKRLSSTRASAVSVQKVSRRMTA